LTAITQRTVGSATAGSARVGWTFLLPLVAVDPAAEADLLHLDKAVIHGAYLPTAAAAPHEPFPLIAASSVDDGEQCVLAVTLGGARGTTTITAAQAYQALLRSLRGSAATAVPAFWTATPVRYARSANGRLIPQPVAGNGPLWVGPYLRNGASP